MKISTYNHNIQSAIIIFSEKIDLSIDSNDREKRKVEEFISFAEMNQKWRTKSCHPLKQTYQTLLSVCTTQEDDKQSLKEKKKKTYPKPKKNVVGQVTKYMGKDEVETLCCCCSMLSSLRLI